MLVREGVFSDAGGDYGRGTYIRDPPAAETRRRRTADKEES
ncbi:cupin domain-containing protein [Candidatus Accumulibacter sp. ACC003]|nr:cupin domain-containing protein [Candidatus Accumulibacter sp. ACC003]